MKSYHKISRIFRGSMKLTARALVTVSLLFTYLCVNGQTEFKGFYFNPKLGMCLGMDMEGFGAGLELGLIRDQRILSFDFYAGEEFVLFGGTPAQFRQLGISFGGYRGSNQARIQFQGGVAPTWGILDSYYTETDYVEHKPYFTVGLTGKIGLQLFMSHSISIGVDLQGNLNMKNPTFFPSVSLEIGSLKERYTAPPVLSMKD